MKVKRSILLNSNRLEWSGKENSKDLWMEHNGKWNKKSVVTPEIIQEQGKASIIFQYLSGTWNHYRQMACLQWAAQQQKKRYFLKWNVRGGRRRETRKWKNLRVMRKNLINISIENNNNNSQPLTLTAICSKCSKTMQKKRKIFSRVNYVIKTDQWWRGSKNKLWAFLPP